MDAATLVVAVALAGIGLDILRFPKQPPPTVQQDEEAAFGKGTRLPYDRQWFFIWRGMYGAAPRSAQVRALAVVLLVVSVLLGAKGFGLF